MAVTFNFPGFIPQNTRQQFYYHLRNHFSKNYLYISNIKLIIIKGKIEFVHLKQIQQFRILNSIQNNRSSQQKVLFIYFLDSLFYISFFVPVVSIFRVKIAPSSQSLSFRSLSQFAVHMSHIMVGLQLLLLPDCVYSRTFFSHLPAAILLTYLCRLNVRFSQILVIVFRPSGLFVIWSHTPVPHSVRLGCPVHFFLCELIFPCRQQKVVLIFQVFVFSSIPVPWISFFAWFLFPVAIPQ